jgi:ATP-binding cassette subfamily F protein 3
MISIENLSVEFGGFTLLNDISFVLNKNERTALVGKNGAGKSTLLKIIAGIQHPSRGIVSYPKGISIGYLPQQMKLDDTLTVKEEAAQAFKHLQEMENELEKLHRQLAERTDYESEDYQRIIQRSADLQELLLMSGVNNFEAEIEKTLTGLGFSRKILTVLPKNSAEGGACASNWRKFCCRPPMCCYWMSPPIISISNPSNGLRNFLATHANAADAGIARSRLSRCSYQPHNRDCTWEKFTIIK